MEMKDIQKIKEESLTINLVHGFINKLCSQ